MRKSAKIVWVLFAVVSASVCGASAARADDLVTAHVPFAFIVGDSRLPAGDYVVKQLDDDPDVIQITSTRGHQATFTMTQTLSSTEMSAQPRLVFEKFENQYFLSQVIREDGNDREIILTPSIMEHEMAAAR